MLPTFTGLSGLARAPYGVMHDHLRPTLTNPSHFWQKYAKRLFSWGQWDLDRTAFELINSCRAPAKVYKITQHRKIAINQWARDDPSFFVILLGLLAATAIGYGLAYGVTSPLSHAWLVTQLWLQFVVPGLLIATSCWAIANKYLRASIHLPHSVEQEVEWLFAWDVQCNAFVPVFLLCYVGQYLLLPFLTQDGYTATVAGNLLYMLATVYYWYVTFSGYLILPFLSRQNVFLAPVGVLALLLLGATVGNISVPRFIIGLYVA